MATLAGSTAPTRAISKAATEGGLSNDTEWEYAGVFADYGISGTGTKKREEFNRMLAECEAGHIDIILTKSIQRFARNTVDLLNTVRHLKDLGIEVRFEKENINSMSGDGELMMSILASFAQEESRSISENVKVIWQCNHKFEEKKCTTPTLTEDQLKDAFLRAANEVIDAKDAIIDIYHEVLEPNLATDAMQQELGELETEINVTAGLIEDCIKENAHVALDQAEYQKRYDALVDRFDTAKARQKVLAQQITDRQARRQQIEMFLEDLKKRETLTVFRDEDWLAMVDYVTVSEDAGITVTFKDGTEIDL